MTNYIAYYRVSTRQQGNTGLGIEAQKESVKQYLKEKGILIDEYIEVESGKNNNRTELNKALNQCKQSNSTLVIAKLDRLSRNVSFIFALRDSGINFVCCDLPEANTMTIGIMATMAQYERELISRRTKEALKEKKRQGIKLGCPKPITKKAQQLAWKTRKEIANKNENNIKAYSLIELMIEKGISLAKIADKLNKDGFKTSTGKSFKAMTVKRIYDRYQKN